VALLGPVAMIGVPALANRALGAPVEAPAFPGWAAVPLALSVLLTWLYLRTGRSVLIVTCSTARSTRWARCCSAVHRRAYLQLWLLVVAATAAWAAAVGWADPLMRPIRH